MTYPYTPAQLEDDRAYRESADPSEKERPRLRQPGEGVDDYRIALGWDKPSSAQETLLGADPQIAVPFVLLVEVQEYLLKSQNFKLATRLGNVLRASENEIQPTV
jgi:hypothetical protein